MKKNKSVRDICLNESLLEKIEQLYETQHRSIGEVAGIIGCSHNTMQVVLGIMGYPHSGGEWLVTRIEEQKKKIEEYKAKRKKV